MSVALSDMTSLAVTDLSSPSGCTVTGFSIASFASAAVAVIRCLPSFTEALARKSKVPRVASPAATLTLFVAGPSKANQLSGLICRLTVCARSR